MRRSPDLNQFNAAALVSAVMALTPACKNDAETKEPQTEASASAEASLGKEGVKAEANTNDQSDKAQAQTPQDKSTEVQKTETTAQAPEVKQPAMDVVKGARIKLHRAGTFLPGANVNIVDSYGSDNALQDAYNCVATGTPDVAQAEKYGFSPVTEAKKDDLSLVARAFQYTAPNGSIVNATAVQASIKDQKAYQLNVKTGDLSGANPDLVREVGAHCKQQAEALKATLKTDGQSQ